MPPLGAGAVTSRTRRGIGLSLLADQYGTRVEQLEPGALDVVLRSGARPGRDHGEFASGRAGVGEPGRQQCGLHPASPVEIGRAHV